MSLFLVNYHRYFFIAFVNSDAHFRVPLMGVHEVRLSHEDVAGRAVCVVSSRSRLSGQRRLLINHVGPLAIQNVYRRVRWLHEPKSHCLLHRVADLYHVGLLLRMV